MRRLTPHDCASFDRFEHVDERVRGDGFPDTFVDVVVGGDRYDRGTPSAQRAVVGAGSGPDRGSGPRPRSWRSRTRGHRASDCISDDRRRHPGLGPRETTTTVKAFDPLQPIDLSGTPGVTPAQQAAAEQLVRDTLRDLPRFANPSAAQLAGYRSIGDGFTGDEHFINLAYMNDGHVLDSMHPESLVYNTRTGTRILEAAMYMLSPGSRFTDVPPLFQSPLTQWHVHNDLCFYVNPADPKQILIGSTAGGSSGGCPAGQYLAGNEPMLHVWIVKNPCGPFAALEGIGAGQVAPGESRNCDSGHAGVL